MHDPNEIFSDVKRYKSPLQKIFEAGEANSIPWNERIFKCECCNDTGIVQAWKLSEFVPDIFGRETGFDHTYPVFCRQFDTCGEFYAYVANSEDKVKGNLFTTPDRSPTLLFETVRSGAHTLLNQQQSAFIQRKVLELRKEIGTRQIKAKQALSEKPTKDQPNPTDLPF